MANENNNRGMITLLVVVVLGVIAYAVLTMPDRRTGAEKVGDAISELPNGVDKAAEQLQDRTPGEKLGDAVEDAGERIKDSTDR